MGLPRARLYDFNTSAYSRRALTALLSINVNNVCPIFSAWKGPYFVKLQLKILSLGKWHSYLWRSTYQNFSISQSVKAKSALVCQCISSDQKSHTIRHSWKRWWILARAISIPESSPESWPESSPESWRKYLIKTPVWLFPVSTHVQTQMDWVGGDSDYGSSIPV